jgi:hypothetical protein
MPRAIRLKEYPPFAELVGASSDDYVRSATGIEVRVLNAGYTGATTPHLFNCFLNKIIALEPLAVVYVASIVDEEACKQAPDSGPGTAGTHTSSIPVPAGAAQ